MKSCLIGMGIVAGVVLLMAGLLLLIARCTPHHHHCADDKQATDIDFEEVDE